MLIIGQFFMCSSFICVELKCFTAICWFTMTYIRVLCKKIKRDYFNYVEDSLQRHKRTGSHNCNIEVLMNHAKVSKMQRKFGKQQCVI